ncbi:MAG: alpha/beta hydrolase [Pseudomonadota bacterium]
MGDAAGEHQAAMRETYRRLANTGKVHWTPCGDGRMAWREWGAGPTVAVLHGGSGSWRHWIANIPTWQQHFRLLVADLPGLGDSDMPPKHFDHDDLLSSVRDLADIVIAGIRALADGPVHVVGFSAGSITGAQMTAAYPDEVLSLHLAGASGLGIPWGGLAGRLRGMRDDMTREERLGAQGHNLGLIMLSQPAAADSIEAELQLDNAERARLRTHPLADSNVLGESLPRIQCPVHSIWGELDPYAQPELDKRVALFRQHFPRADLQTLSGAGHWVMYERADVYTDAVLRQLQNPEANFC